MSIFKKKKVEPKEEDRVFPGKIGIGILSEILNDNKREYTYAAKDLKVECSDIQYYHNPYKELFETTVETGLLSVKPEVQISFIIIFGGGVYTVRADVLFAWQDAVITEENPRIVHEVAFSVLISANYDNEDVIKRLKTYCLKVAKDVLENADESEFLHIEEDIDAFPETLEGLQNDERAGYTMFKEHYKSKSLLNALELLK
jgi:hypothetical protein